MLSDGENMHLTKISSKGQTTIPVSVRQFLSVDCGDEVIFQLDKKNNVILRKAHPVDIEYLKGIQATLSSEWDSPEDNEAYNDL